MFFIYKYYSSNKYRVTALIWAMHHFTEGGKQHFAAAKLTLNIYWIRQKSTMDIFSVQADLLDASGAQSHAH